MQQKMPLFVEVQNDRSCSTFHLLSTVCISRKAVSSVPWESVRDENPVSILCWASRKLRAFVCLLKKDGAGFEVGEPVRTVDQKSVSFVDLVDCPCRFMVHDIGYLYMDTGALPL